MAVETLVQVKTKVEMGLKILIDVAKEPVRRPRKG